MRDDRQIPRCARHLDRLERFAQRADLIDLDENRIRDAVLDAAREALRVRDEQVVADELTTIAEARRELRPTIPVVFGQSILDGHDWIFVDPILVELNHALRVSLAG